jgi:DNA-binding MarR family transcriptional regulator
MESQRELLVEQAMQAQKRVYLLMHAAAGPAWLETDLTLAQIKGLFLLAREEASTISRIALALGVGRPASSILVERLVELGLVERAEDPVDRRRTLVRLSPRGEELIAQLRQDGRERLREWLGRLSEDDLAALVRGLSALAAAASLNRWTPGQ